MDAGEARAHLNDRIREIFGGRVFEMAAFPGGPFDVPDEVGDGRPKLVVPSFDAVTIGAAVEAAPELVERIYSRKGSEGSALRALRNHLVFVVADDARTADMRNRTRRRLALREMKKPEHLAELAEHQQAKVRELEARSEQELAITVQQCYRHVFYPSRHRVGASGADLAHSAIDVHSTSDRPGVGQQQVVRALRDLGKLRLPEDEPDSPAYVTEYEIWQMPSIATPQIASATRIAGLRGRNLELVEHRVLKRLGGAGIKLGPSRRRERQGYALTEDLALTLGLLFRVLAPMRSRDNMRAVAEGIEAMGREEAAYWLGMAMHRRHPRRVLTALRCLLIEPRRRKPPV